MIYICSELFKLDQSSTMKLFCAIKTVLCLIGPFTVLWYFVSTVRTEQTVIISCQKHRLQIHQNAKLIYEFHLILSILASVSYGIQYVVDTYRFSFSTGHCDRLLNTSFSFPLLLFAVTMDWGQGCLFLALAIERVIASIYHRTYERNRSRRLAYILILICMLFTTLSSLAITVPGIAWGRPTMAFSIVNTNTEVIVMIIDSIHTVVEVLAILIFHVVLLINKRHFHNRYKYSLGSNYQMTENRRVTIVMLPIFYVHFIIFVMTKFSTVVFLHIFTYDSPSNFAIFAEYVIWTPVYSVIAPLILPIVDRYRKKILGKEREKHAKNVFIPMDVLFNRTTKKQIENFMI